MADSNARGPARARPAHNLNFSKQKAALTKRETDSLGKRVFSPVKLCLNHSIPAGADVKETPQSASQPAPLKREPRSAAARSILDPCLPSKGRCPGGADSQSCEAEGLNRRQLPQKPAPPPL
ncbi:hypothetical protein BOO71_0013867 [Deinococcus marmoris]|uniref:Uncharacterized protein n=1 Tax=Deinococcus marmoris TaxID=249408 RepID=A0A1U7NS53_9DEIO|nr:hypothetical protein BOO71_0013867 [Deinococcus marmoris]